MQREAMKTVLITGATGGIGREAALHLARAGFRVIGTGRGEAGLAALRRDAEALGVTLETARLDVTDEASIRACAERVRELAGGIDVLVNNAGYGLAGPLEEVSDADLRAVFDTNVFGLMAVTRAFLPQLRARKGRVLNVSSVGGRVTFPFFGAYHATKYAVEALSDALRRELAPFGVQVVLIEPGAIRTEFSERSVATLNDRVADTASPYAAIYARAREIQALSDSTAVGPEVIAKVTERAIQARRPAARYIAPFQSRIMVALLTTLPTRWVDAMLRRMLRHEAPASTPAQSVEQPRALAS